MKLEEENKKQKKTIE